MTNHGGSSLSRGGLNEVVAAGTGWLGHGLPSPDKNIHRRVLIRVANHTGSTAVSRGEYLELVDGAIHVNAC
jgi:hypothetical protein